MEQIVGNKVKVMVDCVPRDKPKCGENDIWLALTLKPYNILCKTDYG